MIARITRLLLLIQFGAAIGFGMLAIRLWPEGGAGAAVLCGLAAVIVVRFLITLNNFRIARRFSSALPEDCRLGWSGRLRLVVNEFRSTMWSSSWTMPFRRLERHVVPDAAGLPVLLVHGYGCNSGYWHAMGRTLRRAGITHYAVDLAPVFGSIDDYAGLLHETIETVCRETGSARLVIVAHSMGGLAARAYLRAHGTARIARIVTLGTPHHGTALAHSGVGRNSAEMQWTPGTDAGTPSAWLQALAAREDAATRALFVSIWSRHDNIVTPQASSVLPGARNVALHGIGHVEMALHPQVQALVIDEVLDASRMETPVPARSRKTGS